MLAAYISYIVVMQQYIVRETGIEVTLQCESIEFGFLVTISFQTAFILVSGMYEIYCAFVSAIILGIDAHDIH